MTGEELVSAIEEISDRVDSIRYIVNDFNAVTNLDVADETLTQIVAEQGTLANRRSEPLRFALVSNDDRFDDVLREYVRRVAQHGLPWTINIFESLDEAREWAESAR